MPTDAPPDPMADRPADRPAPRLRDAVMRMQAQLIVEVARLGLGQPDTIPLWFGESDLPTPKFVCDAAAASLAAGETFYTHQLGLPELRVAISDYMTRLYAKPVAPDRIIVTNSGMTAIMLTLDAVVDPGDNAVFVTPLWPNAVQSLGQYGAAVRRVPLRVENGVWRLDLDRLFDACDARTRLIFVNSPGNPTGWVMAPEEQRALLDFARARGIWILSDEVYNRLCYDAPAAPSFADLAEPDDPVFIANSFSKNWAMTGWRVGWLTAPPWVSDRFAQLVQVSTSGTPVFVQRGAFTAVTEGEPFVAAMRDRCRAGRDVVVPRLKALPRVSVDEPRAAFYAFFKVDGVTDSLAFAKALYLATKVGIAPGAAFGPEGEGWFRLCFASDPALLATAMDRLEAYLGG